MYDGYGSNGSNGSNGSKSGARTIPSPQRTTRTPSPSDEGGAAGPRNSISPEGHPRTAELIRRADKILAGREATAAKAANDSILREEASPPPDSVVQDHRALRLICNGFEVLTAKMPRPRQDMGPFTLASVGWEKAGIISPKNPSKGVSMSFSNGMMTPTEGIVVTFSNGSMCFLTLRDPLSALQSLKVEQCTPTVVFSFACVGQLSVGELLAQNPSSLGPEASQARAAVDKPNVFVMEIGHSGGISAPASLDDVERENSERHLKTKTLEAPTKDPKRAESPTAKKSRERSPSPRYPAVLISAIPRAVPLFVNTINQTFIDPPCYEVPENAYENELLSDRYEAVRTRKQRDRNAYEAQPARQQEPTDDKVLQRPNEESQAVSAGPPSGTVKLPSISESLSRSLPSNPPVPSVSHCASPVAHQGNTVYTPLHAPANPVGSSQLPAQAPRHPSMYNYYYGPGHLYPADGRQGAHALPSNSTHPRPPVDIHGRAPPMAGAHGGYYHHVQAGSAAGRAPDGHYHHHPNTGYPPPYFAVPPPPGLMHQSSQNAGQWHSGAAPVAHQAAGFPPPHPMDARRDMPAHFATHRAVASSVDGRYQSPYYHLPADARHAPCQGESAKYSEQVRMAHKEPEGPTAGAPSKEAGLDRLENGKTANANTIGPSQSQAVLDGQRATDATGTISGQGQRRVPNVSCTPVSAEDARTGDKEHALHALIQMRQGGENGRLRESEKRPRNQGDVRNQNGIVDCSNHGSEQRTSPTKARNPNASTDAYNMGERVVGRTNGIHSALKGRAGSSRPRRSSGTSSSTSTNSQGGALVNGAVTGNSHASVLSGYATSPPNQKRVRKR